VDAILSAAEELIRERGYAGTTTNHIARRAGVNVALVYRYFAGKEAIVGALIDHFTEVTVNAARASLDENAAAPLSVAIRELLRTLATTPAAPALHRELTEHVDLAKRRELVREAGNRITALFEHFLATRASELRPMKDREATFFVLRHAVDAATQAVAFYRPRGVSADRALDVLTDLCLRALGGEAD